MHGSMLVTILVILVVLWLVGGLVPVNAGRPYYTPVSWGGGGVGLLIVILLVLAIIGVI